MKQKEYEYRCPLCNSADVEQLMVVWENLNTEAFNLSTGAEPAELYNDRYWCNSCVGHFDEPVIIEK